MKVGDKVLFKGDIYRIIADSDSDSEFYLISNGRRTWWTHVKYFKLLNRKEKLERLLK